MRLEDAPCRLLAIIIAVAPCIQLAQAQGLAWEDKCGSVDWYSCCEIPFTGLKRLNWDRGPASDCPPFPGPGERVDLDRGDSVVVGSVSLDQRPGPIIGGMTMRDSSSFTLAVGAPGGSGMTVNGPMLVGENAGDECTFTFNRGHLYGSGDLTIGVQSRGILDASDSATLGKNLVNLGETRWVRGRLHSQYGAAIFNFGDFKAQADNEYVGLDLPGAFHNYGLLTRQGLGKTTFSGPFNNFNSVDVQGGSLRLTGGGRCDAAAFAVGSGTLLDFAAPVTNARTYYTFSGHTVIAGNGWTRGAPASSLNVTGQLSRVEVENFELDGGFVEGDGSFDVDTFFWLGGALLGTGDLTVLGVTEITGANSKVVGKDALLLIGPTVWNDGDLSIQGNGVIGNYNDFIFASDDNLYELSPNNPVFNNYSRVIKQDSFGVSRIQTTFNVHDGASVEVESGTLEISGGGIATGAFVANGGALLRFSGDRYDLSGTPVFAGPGVTQVAGELRIQAADSRAVVGNMQLAGGTLNGRGDFELQNLSWTLGSMIGEGATFVSNLLDISGPGSKSIGRANLIIQGDAQWSGSGAISLQGRALVNNLGNFSIVNNSSIDTSVNTTLFFNSGRFVKEGGGGATRINVPFELAAEGVVDVESGLLAMAGGGLARGTFNVIGEDNLLIFTTTPFTLTGQAGIAGDGWARAAGDVNIMGADSLVSAHNFEINLGRLGGDADFLIDNLKWSIGSIVGDRDVAVTTTALLNGTGSKSVVLSNLALLGASTWSETGAINLQNGGRITNRGTFNILNDTTVSGASPSAFLNEGEVVKIVGFTSGTRIEAPYVQSASGRTEVQAGTFSLRNGGIASGEFEVRSGGVLEFFNPLNRPFVLTEGATITGGGITRLVSGGLEVQGSSTNNVEVFGFELAGGDLRGGGNFVVNNLLWNGGSMSGSGKTIVQGGAGMLLQGVFNKHINRRELTLAAPSYWVGAGDLNLENGAMISNLDEFHIGNDEFIGSSGANNVFENAGDVIKDAGAGVSKFMCQFNNLGSGTLKVNSGSIDLAGGGLNDGGAFDIGGGSNITISAGTYHFGDQSGAAGDGVLRVANAGTLYIDGDEDTVSGIFNLEVALGGRIDGPGLVGIVNFDWTGGSLVGAGAESVIVVARGEVDISGDDGKLLVNRSLGIGCPTVWTGNGDISLQGTAKMLLLPNASFDVQNDRSIMSFSNSCSFENQGAFRKTAGAGVSVVDLPFINRGKVEASNGTLEFRKSFENRAGDLNLSDARIRFTGSLTSFAGKVSGRASLAGRLAILGGELTPNSNSPFAAISCGEYQQSSGTLTIDIGGLAPGDQYDVISAPRAIIVGGSLRVRLANGYRPPLGASFDIITAGTLSGSFRSVSVPRGMVVQYLPGRVRVRNIGAFNGNGRILGG